MLLSKSKAPDCNASPTETLYNQHFPELSVSITEAPRIPHGVIPKKIKIVPLSVYYLFNMYNNLIYDNHQGISLLLVASRILTRIMLNCQRAKKYLSNSQFGFGKERATEETLLHGKHKRNRK